MDLVQREIINSQRRADRATVWGRLRLRAMRLRAKARITGCRGNLERCTELGYRAALLEAEAFKQEREWNLKAPREIPDYVEY
jgi:hypothetical protein